MISLTATLEPITMLNVDLYHAEPHRFRPLIESALRAQRITVYDATHLMRLVMATRRSALALAQSRAFMGSRSRKVSASAKRLSSDRR